MPVSSDFHEPGSHLRVLRQFADVVPYYHHGIYIGGDEVVEFGGGHLWDKGLTQVRRVSLSDFERGSTAAVVRHPITWMGMQYSPAGTPSEVIDRALWLLDHQPPGYQIAVRNCEYIANWCATGDFESFQTKGFMAVKGVILDVPFLFALRRLSSRAKLTLFATSMAITCMTALPYILDSRLPDHLRKYPGLDKD